MRVERGGDDVRGKRKQKPDARAYGASKRPKRTYNTSRNTAKSNSSETAGSMDTKEGLGGKLILEIEHAEDSLK